MITVWHDWDSGPYETISTERLKDCPTSELSKEELNEYMEVLKRYIDWQTRLRDRRKQHESDH